MKETKMPLVYAANLVASSGNIAYGVKSFTNPSLNLNAGLAYLCKTSPRSYLVHRILDKILSDVETQSCNTL